MNSPAGAPGPDEVGAFAFRVWGYKQGEMVSLLIHLGDRLGLYRHLDGAGLVTADELAERTGLHARWLREWLRGNAAAELLASGDGEHFELTGAGAMVLAREDDSLQFAAGAFGAPPEPGFVEDLAEAFRTGAGMPYDRHGPAGVHRTERMLGPWARLSLVPTILPALEDVAGRLAEGALVADVGCGAGVALTSLARAYPASTFHGYELSRSRPSAPGRGSQRRGLPTSRSSTGGPRSCRRMAAMQLVITFDCLHDMTRPDAAAGAIRGAIAEDGDLAGQGDPLRGHLGGQPAQSDARDVPRVLGLLLHVLRAFRSRAERASARSACRRRRPSGSRATQASRASASTTSKTPPTSTTRSGLDRERCGDRRARPRAGGGDRGEPPPAGAPARAPPRLRPR